MLSPMATCEHDNRTSKRKLMLGKKPLCPPNTVEPILPDTSQSENTVVMQLVSFYRRFSHFWSSTLIYEPHIHRPPSSQNDWFLCSAAYWQHWCQWDIKEGAPVLKMTTCPGPWVVIEPSHFLQMPLHLYLSAAHHWLSHRSPFSSVSVLEL